MESLRTTLPVILQNINPNCTLESINNLIPCFSQTDYKRNQPIIRQGEIWSELLVIESGYTSNVNHYYTESWDPTNLPNDWQHVRQQWNDANAVRVVTSFSAFLLAALALLSRTIDLSSEGNR